MNAAQLLILPHVPFCSQSFKNKCNSLRHLSKTETRQFCLTGTQQTAWDMNI